MTLELYAAFVVASAVVLAIPGPTILMVTSYALSGGRRTALFTVPGVALGDSLAVFLSLAGVGAILAASATLFSIVKLAGAGYLVWLGLRMWRTPAFGASNGMALPHHDRSMLRRSFVVTALNPKSILFFIAFLPQFVSQAAPAWPQLVLLGSTFVVMGALNALIYALLAAGAGRMVRSSRTITRLNRLAGTLLIGAGLWAALRRTPS